MKKMNYGYDRADEIIEYLSDHMKQNIIIGGCTMDDNNFLKNYQFCNHSIEKNSLLTLNLSLSSKVYSNSILGYKPQEKTFKIDKISKDKHIVSMMDGKGARSALFDKLNLKLEEKEAVYNLYKNIYYYPLGFNKNGIWHACMIGLIYGENLVFGNIIKDNELTLLCVSIEDTIKKLNSGIEEITVKKPNCVFGFACETFIETLGKNIFSVQKAFNKVNVPFLIPFVAGESIYTPELGPHHFYESINFLTFCN
jgi:hypothetical protein